MTPDPTPQLAHDHGAAGFCTDHAQRPDERTETVARVLREHGWGSAGVIDDEVWCATCDLTIGRSNDGDVPDAVVHAHQAAAVVAALDDETARLRAEVEWVTRAGQAVARGGTTRIEILTADLAVARAALDRVRALADDRSRHGSATGWYSQVHTVVGWDDLRAALDPEEPQACHLRTLPHERYDAVLDSGPEEPR